MSEEVPATYIEDPKRAEEIAYASKEERCLLVASRLVDRVLADIYDDDDNLASKAMAAIEMAEIYAVYPEAFRHLPKTKKLGDPEHMLEAMPVIIKHNGLPLNTREDWSLHKVSNLSLEMNALQKESIAEVLLDSPPSEDFLKDNNLTRLTHDKDKVEVIAGLTRSYEFFRDLSEEESRKTKRFFERYNDPDLTDSKLKTILREIEMTAFDLRQHLKDSEFENQVKEAENDGSTTLESLEHFLRKGRVRLELGYMVKAEEKLRVYGSIMSGEAANYTSEAA